MAKILLKDKYPEIFAQIDIEKTKKEFPGINIDNISYGSSKYLYWKCNKCGGTYISAVNYRTGNYKENCPYCAGKRVLKGFNDLQTKFPDIAKEWDYEKNYPTKPDEVVPGSHKCYWFKCKNGHQYFQRLSNRAYLHQSCPYCSHQKILFGFNDLYTWCIKNNRNDILDFWDYKKNLLTPKEIFPNSHKKYWFICKNGHSYKQSINKKSSESHGCPYCSFNKSAIELTIYEIYKKYVDNDTLSGAKINNFEIDIYSPRHNLCTEYDGEHYHNSDIVKAREERKNISILEDSHNYTFIRIKETHDIINLNKFKEILPSGLIIYYIYQKYNNKYFRRLSEIFDDIFNIKINAEEIKKTYFEKKRLRNN